MKKNWRVSKKRKPNVDLLFEEGKMKTIYFRKVTGHELDSNSHVNNAVYINYLEDARWEGFNDMGAMDMMGKKNIYPVITETEIKYCRELKMFDEIKVVTKWDVSSPFIINTHKIIRISDKSTICKAKCKLLFIKKNRELIDIPEEIEKLLLEEKKIVNEINLG